MNGAILITGATGNVGGEIIRQLGDTPNIRAAVLPNEQRPLPPNVTPVVFDFMNPETFGPALEGVEVMFLMRPPAISDVPRYIQPAIDAAERAGVRRIVLLSLLGAEKNKIVPHAKIEDALLASKMEWVFLRCGFFMQNLTTTHRAEIRDRHEIFIPAGAGKTSFIDVRDIATVAVKALLEPEHAGKAYPLTGSEALTYSEVANILSEELGQPIRYANPSLPRFALAQKAKGYKWDYVIVTTAIYATTRMGMAGHITGEVERLTGHQPISFRQFAHDNRELWLHN